MAKLYPDRGQMLPDFALSDTRGELVHTESYRQRSNLVLLFINSHDESEKMLLNELVHNYPSFAEEEAEILAVVQGSRAEAEILKKEQHLPFPVLSDVDGRVHKALGAVSSEGNPATAVYIADRFGEIFTAFRTAEGAPVPNSNDIQLWLRFIEHQCPE